MKPAEPGREQELVDAVEHYVRSVPAPSGIFYQMQAHARLLNALQAYPTPERPSERAMREAVADLAQAKLAAHVVVDHAFDGDLGAAIKERIEIGDAPDEQTALTRHHFDLHAARQGHVKNVCRYEH